MKFQEFMANKNMTLPQQPQPVQQRMTQSQLQPQQQPQQSQSKQIPPRPQQFQNLEEFKQYCDQIKQMASSEQEAIQLLQKALNQGVK